MLKKRHVLKPLTHIFLASVVGGLLMAMAWLLVRTIAEGNAPADTVARDGRKVTATKQFIEWAFQGFFAGFIGGVIMSMYSPGEMQETGEYKREKARNTYKAEHPCASDSDVDSATCPAKQ